ncbi:MAG TPA: Ldh family oxidoreductase [Ramlibacter sp.]|uniref:Ldh family oxidoreductase n=1 Tax=Ramlibacter sp. TaxID=1917967 RepID=UPI002BA6F76F|nr:Ldh family oxidoreductase [Ramlibacter sp.]HVZ42480.1 Ldh family oxidoreductase [Ramlibacter sp.]
MKIAFDEAVRRVALALTAAGASEAQAASTAAALVRAQAQGLGSHGLSRVAQYASHLRHGRVDGRAVPRIAREHGAALLVDACDGFCFPACELAVERAMQLARNFGVSFVGVTNSHHAGVLVDHLRPAAREGLIGLGFANSPAAMPAAGGRHAIFGTNPVAAIFPRRDAEPIMIDLALSQTARGKIAAAAKKGEPIPPGWALDAAGNPTTDAKAAMQGSMLPLGGAKGAMLALVVEVLVTALTGARIGSEADSFFEEAGNRPRIGQAFLLIDPRALAGREVYDERIEALIAEMLADDGVRLAGARRMALEREALRYGVEWGLQGA